MGEAYFVIVDEFLCCQRFFFSSHRRDLFSVVSRPLPGHVKLRDAYGQAEDGQRIERTPQFVPVERLAVQVALNADARNWNALRKQLPNLCHVFRQLVAGKDVVVIEKQLCIGIAIMCPLCHELCDLRTEPILVVVTMDHLIVQIVFREPSLVPTRDGFCAMLQRLSQFLVVQRLHPWLYKSGYAPEEVMGAE